METTESEHTCPAGTEQPQHESHEEPGCSGACSHSDECIEIEFEASKALSKKLLSDLRRSGRVPQLDGNHDTSSSEDDYDDDEDGNDDDEDKEEGDDEGEEEVSIHCCQTFFCILKHFKTFTYLMH